MARQPGEPFLDAAGRLSDQHVQQVIAGQAHRLRRVAASGSWARRLAAIGFVVFALGTGIITGLLLRLPAQVDNAVAAAAANPAAEPSAPSIFGQAIGGVPLGVLGFAAALIGIVVMMVGIVPHLSATSRQRCLGLDAARPRELPPPRELPSPQEGARPKERLVVVPPKERQAVRRRQDRPRSEEWACEHAGSPSPSPRSAAYLPFFSSPGSGGRAAQKHPSLD